jgi:hypothetical protein
VPRIIRNDEAGGSIPPTSTTIPQPLKITAFGVEEQFWRDSQCLLLGALTKLLEVRLALDFVFLVAQRYGLNY